MCLGALLRHCLQVQTSSLLPSVQGKLWKSSDTHRGYVIITFVGDDMNEQVPSYGGLLDVVRQEFRRLIWTGEQMEEEAWVLLLKLCFDIPGKNGNSQETSHCVYIYMYVCSCM